MPSLRHPDLVADFALRLAHGLRLLSRAALRKQSSTAEQKTMENGVQQARNIDGSIVVDRRAMLPGPVLLVDDMVDSRWTMTGAAWLLRSNGCGEVWPLALARTGRGE